MKKNEMKKKTYHHYEKKENRPFNLDLIVSLVLIMITTLGTTIPLHLHISAEISDIQKEMTRFHGRMEKIDAEFKGKLVAQDLEFKMRLCAIEEKTNKKN